MHTISRGFLGSLRRCLGSLVHYWQRVFPELVILASVTLYTSNLVASIKVSISVNGHCVM